MSQKIVHQMLHIYLIRQVQTELISCILLLLVKTSTVLLCARKWKMLNRLRIIHLKQTPMMVKKKKGIKNTSGYLCENHVPYVNTYTCYKNNLHFAVAHSSWSRPTSTLGI